MHARAAGLLLHATSLPSRHGIGDLGEEAVRFLDFLDRAGISWWAMLPVVPPGDGSPYSSPSAFAGSPLLISLDALVEDGLLDEAPADVAQGPVDYAAAARLKRDALREAHARFVPSREFEEFRARHGSWLPDHALFEALREEGRGVSWTEWEAPLRHREPAALDRAREGLGERVAFHEFVQFVFHRQWRSLRALAADRGVRLFGDLPIFVAHDSADVWAHQGIFKLDEEGRSRVVTGVPPDAFSETGQLWGNPTYRWDVLDSRGYDWWIHRLRSAFELFDAVRIDHFLGFQRGWEVPAGAADAREGNFEPGPGDRFFAAVREALGEPLLIAENLGLVTEEAEALRRRWGLPGMQVLHFSFGDGAKRPHDFSRDTVVYTATHDNDTTRGWMRTHGEEAQRALRYAGGSGDEPWREIVRLAWMSVGVLAVAPVQDVLGLGSEARLNRPGAAGGSNWRWRMPPDALTPDHAAWLRTLSHTYER